MSRETCVEITVKVPLSESTTLASALGVAQTEAIELTRLRSGRELVGVALLADGRRIDIGKEKLKEWVPE